MGQKVNFNNSNKKKNKMKSTKIIVFGVIVSIIILLLIIFNRRSPKEVIVENEIPVKTSISSSPFESLEDLFENYGCKLISSQETKDLLSAKVDFKYNLYTGETSNENFFLNICNVVADYENYKNIELTDTDKDIKIEIICQGARIAELKINGDRNYYLNHNSNLNKNLSKKVTNFTIQSKELQQLIDGNWIDTNVNWGTKESTCNGYNIYFDEGIKYKNNARNVYNVVFTNKYEGQIAGGLTVTSSPEMVKSALGDPSFSERDNIYGYVSENNYLFFDFSNQEISIYPVVNVTKEEESKLRELIEKMNETSDIKRFGTDLISFWIDYDTYNYDSTYIDLRYTLKGVGVSIDSSSLKNGIFIYQNYSGDKSISDLENVYVKDTDFVFEEECDRSTNEYLNRNDEGDYTDEERIEMGLKFAVRSKKATDNNYLRGVLLYSRDGEYPDTELDKDLEVSSYKWYDEYNFIYSVNDDGIYVYNCATRVNTKLQNIEGEITINEIQNDKIIYNENQEISIIIS